MNKLVITIYYFSYNKDFYNINLSILQVENVLSKIFNLKIELRFIKLHYPFLNSNIFANFIGHLILGNFTSNLIKKDSKFLEKKREINKNIKNFEPYKIKSIKRGTRNKNKAGRRFNLVKLFKKLKLIRVNKPVVAIPNIKKNLFNNLNFASRLDNYNTTSFTQANIFKDNWNLGFNNRKDFSFEKGSLFTSPTPGANFSDSVKIKKTLPGPHPAAIGSRGRAVGNINNLFEKNRSKLALLGVKYEIAGRMNRRRSATRTSVVSRSKGSFKFNSKKSLIDHSSFIYKNKNGSFCVKVWLSSNYSL